MTINIKLFKKLLCNRVVVYMLSRYVVYFIQFIVSVFCAVKMGPYYYGLWGFIIMLIGYFARINFGIPNSTTILLIQNKKNAQYVKTIQSSAILITLMMSLMVLCLCIYYYFRGFPFIDKYPIGWLFYIVCLTAILTYFNQLFTNIYRVKGKISLITMSQSIIPCLLLICLLVENGSKLLNLFTLSYLIGNLISCVIFIWGKQISINAKPNWQFVKSIFGSGFFLFVYNCCFYLIILSTRTVVSSYYAVKLFGYFTFAYALADAVILLLDAFSYLIFPKLVDKLNTKDINQVKQTLRLLRVNYMTLSHLMMYVAFLVFPIFTYFMAQYRGALLSMYLVGLSLLLYTNSYGYSTYLMAQNKHKTLSCISIIALTINVLMAVFLAKFMHCSFEYVMIATMLSYFLFSLLCVIYGSKQMCIKFNFSEISNECFPTKLLVPFIIAFIIILSGKYFFIFISLMIFIVLNLKTIKEIMASVKIILKNPTIADVKGVK